MYSSIITATTEFFHKTVPGTFLTYGSLFGSICILFFSWALRKYIVEWILSLANKLTQKTETEIDDLLLEVIRVPLRATVVYFGILGAFYILPLERYSGLENVVKLLFRIGAIIIITWTGVRAIKVVSFVLRRVTSRKDTLLDDKLVPFIEQILRILAIVIGGVMVLQELGYNPSGLLAGLGLGGLAFALAAKDTLSNFFGSIMLLTDKPFNIGDWIKVNDIEGTVELIGFRSTQIRLFDKSLVQVPNGTLATTPIRNFNRRDRRRIYFNVGITYQSTPAMMQASVVIIKKLIEDHPKIRNDFYLVNFTDFGDSALKIMVYCFTTTTVWGEYLDIQEELMLQIMEELNKIKVEFAYPTMTVHMAGDTPEDIESKARMWLDAHDGELNKEKVYTKAANPEELDG
ncbi:mechanosensitive ion channel family protein [Myxococcota bacterium]|nr:mechanosensitive ion channel family protein [Myxococcota bacterium]MBU1379730.1 mechanosensitive ion channel family protein [Myxococcota bacterium]MBU1496886.1 mechanosensitive ion channel family protein [Myxococcota bacterium]